MTNFFYLAKSSIFFLFQLSLLMTSAIVKGQNCSDFSNNDIKAGTRWWWMGSAVDENNLKMLLKQYSEAGIGTLEITPIYGVNGNESNEVDYLSAEWFQKLKLTYDIAEANCINIEMNMGSGWPFGGSFVGIDDAASKLEYNHEFIQANGKTIYEINISAPEKSISASLQKVIAYPQDERNSILELTELVKDNILKWKAPEGDWLVITVFNGHTGQRVKRAGPGAEGYVLNHFDAGSVRMYINYFQNAFEKNDISYPKAFFCDSYEVYDADWTPQMFDEFFKYRGYKLEDNMDKLLKLGSRIDESNQVLADYRKTLNDMLYYNFALQWTTWCRDHGILTRYQAHGSPANILDLYALSDIPEIEGFGITDLSINGLRKDLDHIRINDSDYPTLKFASSAAHVSGKKMSSCESFTWLTEHFRTSLSQIKPELDLLFCAGVNHVFFHGTTYSPKEANWPGWKFYASIDMSPTNSIWRDASYLMNYIELCQEYLQMGQPDNDFLVYVPFEDIWHKSDDSYNERLLTFTIHNMSNIFPEFDSLIKTIDSEGYSCDYVSDAALLGCTVNNNIIVSEGGSNYKAIIIPECQYMPEIVKRKLQSLLENGAVIIWNKLDNLKQYPHEEIKSKYGIQYIRRKNNNGHHYFISNLTDKDLSSFVKLSVEDPIGIFIDPLTGISYFPQQNEEGLFFDLKSGQSIIVQTYNDNKNPKVDSAFVITKSMDVITVNNEWSLTFSENSYPKVKTEYILNSNKLNWDWINETTSQLMGTGVYKTSIYINEKQANQAKNGWLLDLGDVRESARVYVNNDYVGCLWCIPYTIKTNKFHEGWNDIVVEVTNLPANRIRMLEKNGINWRIFKDTNINSVNGKNSFAEWDIIPSGLNSIVSLYPLTSDEETYPNSIIEVEQKQISNGQSYWLNGVKSPIGAQTHGIYIRGGRKSLKK